MTRRRALASAVRALADGLAMVARAPALVAGVAVVTFLSVAPFGAMLAARLQASLDQQPPVALESVEIDAEWWMEFRAHARGLDLTFTPTVIGFAAPLDNLSALLDGSARPLALAGPVAVAVGVWAVLWGGLLSRFGRRRGTGLLAFVAAGFRHAPRLAAISIGAAVVNLLLYLTVHAALFGWLYERLAAHAPTERDAFLIRLVLYAVFVILLRLGAYALFGLLLSGVAAIAAFTRVRVVVAGDRSVAEAVVNAAAFVREHALAVAALYALVGALFVALLAGYGVTEVMGGSRVGGWRAVGLGQAYIVARLFLRLACGASEVCLFQRLYGSGSLPPAA